MDTFLVGQVAFWWAQYKIKPAQIVNYIIDIAVDLVVPTRGPNDDSNMHNWFMSRWHSLERSGEKVQREMEIRDNLRRWDRENPHMNHETIVRTLASGLISILATNVYLSFCRRVRASKR